MSAVAVHADEVNREHRPAQCQHCKRSTRADGRPLEIQYSEFAAKAWVCLSCHLRAQRAERHEARP